MSTHSRTNDRKGKQEEEHTLSELDLRHTALMAVDVQYDFYSRYGTLSVPNGEEVIRPLSKLAEEIGFTVASRDYHPQDHCSFVAQGGQWPAHCLARANEPKTMEEVMEVHGSDLHGEIAKYADLIVSKGQDASKEAYSAFDGTDLEKELKERGITTLVVGGLSTDYCVKATALDAHQAGFKVVVIKSACRAVNVHHKDEARAYGDMRSAGVEVWETVS